MKYEKPYHSEMKYIKNMSGMLSEERLSFLDGKRLRDVDIFITESSRSASARSTGGHGPTRGTTATVSGCAAMCRTTSRTSTARSLPGTGTAPDHIISVFIVTGITPT